MIEKLLAFILVVVLSFLAGWYAAWNPDRFFHYLGNVGTIIQSKIDHDCVAPTGYVCTKQQVVTNPEQL